MAVGRISGPLLAQNLLRNGVDLAFETDLLYLDVTNGRIGVKTNTPQYELDVNGTINALQLLSTSATIGLMTFFSSTSSSTISSIQGPINIIPPALENIYLGANTYVEGDLHATGDITADGNIRLGNSTGTDALFIEAEIKTDLTPYVATGTNISEFSVGTSSTFWQSGYFDTVRTNFIDAGTGTDITMFPRDTTSTWINGIPNQKLTINGDIRVYGGSPIGTAPVVSNVLYVTEDGDDANDGRAEDSSRACRTVTGATRSPYYKQGTVIKVRSGSYYEENPIQLKPYTSVIGDDLRTTFLYPINDTQDLFWVNSGVYIAQMSFLNLRKGTVTRYAPGGTGSYETGAYCVAFPPNLENPIDVYHSPYVQNCTNQSGPWLKDGTMFVPNNTVQQPRVWGTSTYTAGATQILFHTSPDCIDTVRLGDTINSNGFKVDPSVNGPVVTKISNPDTYYYRAQELLQRNKTFLQAEIVAYVNTSFPTLSYSQQKCYRDVGLIIDAISYDATLGGNAESVKAGLSYYNGNTLIIPTSETSATIAAVNYINTLCQLILLNTEPVHYYQTNVPQYVDTNFYGAEVAGPNVQARVNDITDILSNWTSYENAAALISTNRVFIQTEAIAWINQEYPGLQYDQNFCYRDVGLLLDAVQYDLLHKSNVASVKAADFYWNGTTSIIPTEKAETVAAVNFVKNLTSAIVQNNAPNTLYQNTVTQVINTGLTGGAIALTSIQSNFNAIAAIIDTGLSSAPVSTNSTLTSFVVTLSTATISAATSSTTVYFGDTSVYPARDEDVTAQWAGEIADRRLDPHGAGGGALVDGNAPSRRSPIQSFVFDAFTQLPQGGHGIHIINNGYAQLVSVFTIFCDVAVHCESGGIASITNSNSNFGDLCLVAEGYGKLEFAGTIYNPADVVFDTNYNTWSTSPYYPEGFFPHRSEIAVFIPEAVNRPHIGLVMEIVPPDYYINYNNETVPYLNAQGFPGFLSAISNTSTITAGSTTISGIDTTGIAVGHTLNIRDQFGYEDNDFGNGTMYVSTGTVVTGVSYKTITLSKPIQVGGGQAFNDNYFNLYFSGNDYYTILSSKVAPSPITPGQTKIAGQQVETTAALNYLKQLMIKVVSNSAITGTYQTSVTQTIDPSYTNGSNTTATIASEIGIITTIINQGATSTPVIKESGTVLSGATSAIALLKANEKFLKSEVLAFTTSTYVGFDFNELKCYRDVGLIITAVTNDLASGGNFYAAQAGNTYFSKDGTYHIVTIEEGVTDPTAFVDGCVVNFYQRSYMSASGYLFEYVGAGTDYGALPQVGKADPQQTKEVIQLNNGKVFFTSTDQNGDFRIGPGLVISQATGVLSGRTFQKSLYAEMTPFILAVEADTGG